MDRFQNVLSAASTLLGICFVIISGLSLTKSNGQSEADEVAWVSAFLFLTAIVLSYHTLRQRAEAWHSILAEICFLGGMAALTVSTIILAVVLG